MAKKDVYITRTEEILEPIIEENKFDLVDVEYVKEGQNWYLRVYIDKPGGINIDDCELVSRALSEKMDELDFIDDAYILEVSSPGLTRPLKKDKDFQRHIEKEIEIHLYKPIDKQKNLVGMLIKYDKDNIVIQSETKEEIIIERKNISLARPYIEF